MKNLWLLLVALAAVWFFAPFAPCQGDGAAYSATLRPDTELVAGGQPIVLVLTLEIHRDTKLEATAVSGRHLEVTIDGTIAKPIKNAVSGNVVLAGGTRIERRITVEPSEIAVGESAEAVTVGFSWPGLPGASASVKLTPDVSDVKIDDLDLAETRVVLMTNHGSMTLRFYPDKAPNHVRNFIKLSKDGFYNGTQFHRIIRGFMIQGGCPNTKDGATGMPGAGNAGQTLDAEFSDIKHTRGILSMARGPDINSASSQFFIMHGDNPGLDGPEPQRRYSAFGFLEKGSDTLDRIASVPVEARGREMSKPREPVKLHFAALLPAYKKK